MLKGKVLWRVISLSAGASNLLGAGIRPMDPEDSSKRCQANWMPTAADDNKIGVFAPMYSLLITGSYPRSM